MIIHVSSTAVEIVHKIGKILYLCFVFVVIAEITLQLTMALYGVYFTSIARPSRYPSDSQSFRILCVGESTTNGFPYAGHGYPEQLEYLLNQRFPGRKFKVYNLGICAVSSAEIARHFYRNILYYRPHLTILLVGNNNNGAKLWNIHRASGLLHSAHFYLVNCGLNNSKIVKLAKFVCDIIKAYREGGRPQMQRLYSDVYLVYAKADFNNLRQFDHEQNILYMIDVALRYKSRVILANYFYSRENNFLRGLALKNNIPFCDNEKSFLERHTTGSEQELISEDGWHPSEAGYTLMAENFYQAIMKYGLLASFKGNLCSD